MQPLDWCLQYFPCFEHGLLETGDIIFSESLAGMYASNPKDGLVHPQKEIIGTLNAAAICIIPVSLVNTNLLLLIK